MKYRAAAAIAILALVLGAGLSGASAADQDHVRFVLQGWYPDLSGDGRYRGSSFDVEDDLRAGDADWHYGLDFYGRFGRHRLLANYSDGTQSGDGTGIDIDLTRWHGLYGFSLVNMTYFDLGVLGGVASSDVATKEGGTELALDSMGVALGLDAGFRIPVLPMSIRGQVLYVPTDISGDEADLTDAELSLDFHIAIVDLQLGYRYYDLEAENDDGDESNYKWQGPFAGVGLRF